MSDAKKSARLHLLLIALVFFGPLIVAAFMYYGGAFNPTARSNHGTLLEPLINVTELLPELSVMQEIDGFWVLVYAESRDCGANCRAALHALRQMRLMLGNEMDRLVRLFLHGESPPDTVFLTDEHAGLLSVRDSGFSELLLSRKPASTAAGGYYLLDPLGNLVMYFDPETDPRDIVEDVKHLLRLSRIG